MKIIDNINNLVRDDLEQTIKKGCRVSVAAACFSMYAYQELKEQLDQVDAFHFIFTSPTFIKERNEKQKREFYIPRINRENSLYGTEFEIKLRNEMTQKAIAKECAQWIRRKAVFKSNITNENMSGFMTVDASEEQIAYLRMKEIRIILINGLIHQNQLMKSFDRHKKLLMPGASCRLNSALQILYCALWILIFLKYWTA